MKDIVKLRAFWYGKLCYLHLCWNNMDDMTAFFKVDSTEVLKSVR